MALKEPFNGSAPTNNMTQLRNHMLAYADALRADSVPLAKVKEYANLAGKIIKSAATQVDYAVARKEKPDVPFLK